MAIDIRDVQDSTDVDLLMWRHTEAEGKHSGELYESHVHAESPPIYQPITNKM